MDVAKRQTVIASFLTLLALTGCAKHVVLEEISKDEARALRFPLTNSYIAAGPTKGSADLEDMWVHIHVAGNLIASNPGIEKFEEGKAMAQLPSGERLEGAFIGYRPKDAEHCTRSWLGNLRQIGRAHV